MSKKFIDVAAGLILTPDGELLLAKRPGDKLWSGWWELPGGKIEPGEAPEQALVRELNEELGIEVTHSTPWVTYTHEYPKTIVRLAFHRVTGWKGEPSGIEGQHITWVDAYAPPTVSPLLPATQPPLRWLQLPDRYLLTSIGMPEKLEPFLARLTTALESGVKLVQFREPAWAAQTGTQDQEQLYAAFQHVLALCRQHKAYCLVNSVHPEAWGKQADGIHYRAADAAALHHASDVPGSDETTGMPGTSDISHTIDASDTSGDRPDIKPMPGSLRGNRYVGMSAHTAHDLQIARQINADFAVVGHVLDTPSHPGVPGMGWEQFSALNQEAGLPVFAIGGQSAETRDTAAAAGAHGIAGIRFTGHKP